MALSKPVTNMTFESGGNERFDYAVAAMQGYRANMEDAHAIVLNLDDATGTSFFGVYDGHGGPAVSKYCARHLHVELRRHERFGDDPKTAIERTFLRMDEMMRNRTAGKELSGYGGNEYWREYKESARLSRFLPFCQKPPYHGPLHDGCTACVVLIRGNQIIVGNAGDSRCVLSRNDQVIDLSTDFKASLASEEERIVNSGHKVAVSSRGNVHRIDEGIAISRALGDLLYKDKAHLDAQQQAVIAFPEVRTEEITQDAKFLIIACDGIWDCLSSHQAVNLVDIYLQANASLWSICDALFKHCLGHARGKDNMTVVLVRFKTPAGAGQVGAPDVPPAPIEKDDDGQVPPANPAITTRSDSSAATKASSATLSDPPASSASHADRDARRPPRVSKSSEL